MSSFTDQLDVYSDPPLDGPENMARDEWLLKFGAGSSLRLYQWSPATLSLGYFQKYAALADLPADVRALPVVRRTTGGGAILHDRELTYCLVLRSNHPVAASAPADLYRLVHEAWRAVISARGIATQLAPDEFPLPTPRTGPFFCFEKPGRTDLLLGGDKLLGSAQRRVGGNVLQHGSLILENRYTTHPGTALNLPAGQLVDDLAEAFVAAVSNALHLSPRRRDWPAEARPAIAEIRKQYAGDDWTRKF